MAALLEAYFDSPPFMRLRTRCLWKVSVIVSAYRPRVPLASFLFSFRGTAEQRHPFWIGGR